MSMPDRLWYPIAEAAVLMGVSRGQLYDLIKAGNRTNPPDDAIHPRDVRHIGGKLCLSRAYVHGSQLAPVTPITSGLTREDVMAALREALIELGQLLDQGHSIRRVG